MRMRVTKHRQRQELRGNPRMRTHPSTVYRCTLLTKRRRGGTKVDRRSKERAGAIVHRSRAGHHHLSTRRLEDSVRLEVLHLRQDIGVDLEELEQRIQRVVAKDKDSRQRRPKMRIGGGRDLQLVSAPVRRVDEPHLAIGLRVNVARNDLAAHAEMAAEPGRVLVAQHQRRGHDQRSVIVFIGALVVESELGQLELVLDLLSGVGWCCRVKMADQGGRTAALQESPTFGVRTPL